MHGWCNLCSEICERSWRLLGPQLDWIRQPRRWLVGAEIRPPTTGHQRRSGWLASLSIQRSASRVRWTRKKPSTMHQQVEIRIPFSCLPLLARLWILVNRLGEHSGCEHPDLHWYQLYCQLAGMYEEHTIAPPIEGAQYALHLLCSL